MPTPAGGRPARWFLPLAVSLSVLAVAYVAAGSVAWGGTALGRWAGTILGCGAPMLGGLLALKATRRMRGRARTSWMLLGLGAISWSLGNSGYVFYEIVLHTEPPFPGPPDVGFLGAIGLISAGALRYPSAPLRRWSLVRTAMDAAMVGLAVLLIAWVVVIERVYREGGLSSMQGVVGLAYPVADVVAITVLVMAMRRSSLGGRLPLAMLVAGILMLVVADTGFVLTTSAGTYFTGHPIDVGWWGGLALIGLAATAYRPEKPTQSARGLTPLAVLTPYAITLLALGLLAVTWFAGRKVHLFDIALMAALVVLILVRQSAATLDSLSLAAEVQEREDDLRYHAYHDALTQMPNRRAFRERLVAELDEGVSGGAVLFIDLDGFKHVNDTLGHEAGDALLRDRARRLCQVLRESDLVARLGGDEFAVLLGDGVDPQDVAWRIVTALREPFTPPGADVTFSVTGSVGVAPWHSGDTADALLRNADLAMYRAKAAGRDQVGVYEPHLHDTARKRLDLEVALRVALDEGWFRVHYQPIVDLTTGATTGVEALLRWPRDGQLVGPTEFIALAEETGFIVPLGMWVLDQACSDLAAWEAAGVTGLTVSVNVATPQLLDPQFEELVHAVLARRRVPPGQLVLELTERVLLEQNPQLLVTVASLASTGVRLCLDDFGTGFASLSTLRAVPVSTIKIDRTFVAELDGTNSGMVGGVVALARHIGLETVAEGIETPEQYDAAVSSGVRYAQGYLLARPMPADQIPAFVQRVAPVPAAQLD